MYEQEKKPNPNVMVARDQKVQRHGGKTAKGHMKNVSRHSWESVGIACFFLFSFSYNNDTSVYDFMVSCCFDSSCDQICLMAG